jgi:hypothetical protein
MNRYWLGIGAGALAVFGIGMGAMSLGRKGIHELSTALGGTVAAKLAGPIDALRFRLDGRRLGHLETMEVRSDGSWGADAIRIVVRLDDPAGAAALEDCALAGERAGGPDGEARFRCAGEAEVRSGRLVQLGEVRFEPGALVRPLYVAERERRSLEGSDIRRLQASLSSPDGEQVRGQAQFDVAAEGGARHRGVVRLEAGHGRALIDIRDDQGKALFRLSAGEQGVSIDASDRRGRELARLLAGEAGVKVKVAP